MIVGSFLPWVVSGQVRRSSYAVAGVIDRLGIAGDGVLGLARRPVAAASVPLCMLPVSPRCCAGGGPPACSRRCSGSPAAALSIGALVFAARAGRSGSVSLDPLGPAVMAAGAALLLVGGLLLTFRRSSPDPAG